MRFWVLLVGLGLGAAAAAHGATIADTLAWCRAKGSGSERLACYDDLARAVAGGVSLPPLPNVGVGKWVLDQKVDPVDDTLDMYAFLPSEDWRSGLSGALLAIICFGSGNLEVQLLLQGGVRVAYEADIFSIVTWRFDKFKAVTREWIVSEDRQVLYPVYGRYGFSQKARKAADIVDLGLTDLPELGVQQIQWATEVLDHSKLFVRINESGNKVDKGDFLFDLRGASTAVAPLRSACGW